jgi:FkbM family methyltransferase
MSIGGRIQRFKRYVYNGRVKTLVQRYGFEMTLARLYTSFLRYTSAATLTYAIDSQSASFYQSEFLPKELPERPVVKDLLESLRSSDVFFDLGANHGIYTCLAGRKLDSGLVVSFEPNPQTCAELRRNIALNQLTDRVTTFQVAVADESGEADFIIDMDSTGSSLAKSRSASGTESVQVDVVTLDSFVDIESLPAPHVIKIDVEGAEFQALRGMRTLLQKQCRLLYCEVHNSAVTDYNANSTDVEDILRKFGFNVEMIYQREPDHYIIKATNNI